MATDKTLWVRIEGEWVELVTRGYVDGIPVPANAIEYVKQPQIGNWAYIEANGSDPTTGRGITLKTTATVAGGIRLLNAAGGNLDIENTGAGAINVSSDTGSINVYSGDGVIITADGDTGIQLQATGDGDMLIEHHTTGGAIKVTTTTNGNIDITVGSGGFLRIFGLPTTDPGSTGRVWNSDGNIVLSGYVPPGGGGGGTGAVGRYSADPVDLDPATDFITWIVDREDEAWIDTGDPTKFSVPDGEYTALLEAVILGWKWVSTDTMTTDGSTKPIFILYPNSVLDQDLSYAGVIGYQYHYQFRVQPPTYYPYIGPFNILAVALDGIGDWVDALSLGNLALTITRVASI
jgi:hypothetical protein